MKLEIENGLTGASIRSASFDEKDNSIAVIWSTGAAVRRRGSDGYYDEILDMSPAAVDLSRLNAGAPFLDSHRDDTLSRVIGSVVAGSAKIAGGQGVARVKLSRAAGDADNVQKIRDGVIRNISIGYSIHAVEKIERDNDIPIYRVTRWEPLEISAVPIPADFGAGVIQSSRTKSTKSTQAEVRTVPKYSPAAARLRMFAKMQQRGLLRPTGALH